MIIRRAELEKTKGKKRILIYGRRKTGKTFFVKNFLKPEHYLFATKEGSILYKERRMSKEELFNFLNYVKGRIAIDEFHRLGREFLDYLHYRGEELNVVLLTSTLWLMEKRMKKDWPLAGLYDPILFSLADERDVVYSIKDKVKKEEVIEASTYLREPLLYQFYRGNIRKTLINFFIQHKSFVENLIYNIFEEEQRHTSIIYEGILRAISSGKNKAGEISSFLFSKKVISKDDPSLIQQHLNILRSIGLIEKREVYGKKRFYYLNSSPLLDIHFYLLEKYDYVEQDVGKKYIEKAINYKIPFHVEEFFVKLFSKYFGLKPVKIENPEIDIALVELKKLKVVGEVKWGKKAKGIEKLDEFDAKKIFIGKEKINKEGIESYSLKDIIDICL